MVPAVMAAWSRTVAWLSRNAPSVHEALRPPATLTEVARAAAALDIGLPDDLSSLFGLVDGTRPGQSATGMFPPSDEWGAAFGPLSLEEVVDAWRTQKELLAAGDFAGLTAESAAGVAQDWWNVRWIPFAGNGGGDYYCVDLGPTAEGTVGQVIAHSHESGTRLLLARSLADYLTGLADALEADGLEYDDQYGIRPKDSARTAARHARVLEEARGGAEAAFREKDYQTVVKLLAPFEAELDKTSATKLSYARKKSQP